MSTDDGKYIVHVDGKESARYRGGGVTLAGILNPGEYKLVNDGKLLAISERGDMMNLDSPLSVGEAITLRSPQPEDFARFVLPGDGDGK